MDSTPKVKKELRALLELRRNEEHCKVFAVGHGEGKSNDDAERECWKDVRRQVRENYPGATFRARSLYFERTDDRFNIPEGIDDAARPGKSGEADSPPRQ